MRRSARDSSLTQHREGDLALWNANFSLRLTGDQLDRLNGMVREALNAAEGANKGGNSKTSLRRCMISAGRLEIAEATDAHVCRVAYGLRNKPARST